MHVGTWHELADSGEELSSASVTVNSALHKEAVTAISQFHERQEARSRGKDDCRLAHSSLILVLILDADFIQRMTASKKHGHAFYKSTVPVIFGVSIF